MILIDKRDYGKGRDQLEKNYLDLDTKQKNLVRNQFDRRIQMNTEKIAEEVIASDKIAVSPPGWKGTVEKMKEHKDITNPWALCFTGDTKVLLLDGRSLSMIELVNEFGINKITYVYSYDIENDEIVVGKAFNFRKTLSNTDILEIELDNGQKIRCTLFHKFLMNNGEYKDAKDLKFGDSLMPLYYDYHTGSFCNGYLRVWSKSGKKKFAHRISAKMKFGKEWNKGKVIHHNDFNKLNNDPANLNLMLKQEHNELHKNNIIAYNKSEKGRKKSAELRANQGRKQLKKLWSENRQDMIQICRSNGKSTGCTIGKDSLTKYNKLQSTIDRVRQQTINGDMTKAKILKIAKHILDLGLPITREIWDENKGYKSNPSFDTMILLFGSIDNLIFNVEKKFNLVINHKVISVKLCNEKEDVFDFSVEKYHNFALAAGVFVHNSWWMSKRDKGDDWGKGGKLSKKPKPHYKEKKSSIEEIVDDVIGIEVDPIIGSNKKYLTNDSIKTDHGYVNIKTSYEEKDGEVILEEYVVDKNGHIETYNNVEDFVAALISEGLF